jgi:PD-(D/E)XK endonuclease
MNELTPSQKGATAEAEIAAAAIRLRLLVLRPLCEGGRYDLAIDIGERLLRVQCKWASRQGDVLNTRCVTSRHTPHGYIKTTYSADEIDAIAAYAPDTDRCYLIPVDEVESRTVLSLRVAPTRNNQAQLIRWAKDYELEDAIERYWGTQPTLPDLDIQSATRRYDDLPWGYSSAGRASEWHSEGRRFEPD